ncbi:MAG: 50S ribosomal protein L7ae [Oscillospiraceae bacterium]|nr:50S ribosomal protein L7ae [Oscillospiraceae bacterium]
MPNHKILFALSLCRKAGALIGGFDAVKESVMKGKAYLVLYACDISEGTKKRLLYACEDYVDALELPLDQFSLLPICKKPTGVFAVTDEELTTLCRKSLTEAEDKPAALRTKQKPAVVPAQCKEEFNDHQA